ncbi:MAG TPA: beta-galactosidase [Fimbriimonas sp.]
MVEMRDRRLVIDGKPALVFAGEIHYFRLRRDEWEDRVRKAKDLGCAAIASYIPWIVHEQREGKIDVRDVAEFMDLCIAHGLRFLPRPGPFVMAEMKNEGIPAWVYSKHPDAVPVSWDGDKAVTPTLDYLHPGFLEDVERWYAAIMPVVARRLEHVLGVQLDNEIGMLQWVTNQPDLSDGTLCDFARWVVGRYGHGRYPFDLDDPAIRARELRNPDPEIGPRLLRDYGDYERDRFSRYVATLRSFAEAQGVAGVPFIVNIHGSGGGRGTGFPIGIHQLYESYQKEGYLCGSDHYLGELTRENAPDLYFLNAFMNAAAPPWQPIASMEFEVGTGDYGETGAMRMSGAAADLKARLSVVQGNRLINYYLLAGGRNPHLQDPPDDGNGRIAITGERHGFAAPIDPEGNLDPTYHALKETTRRLLVWADKLADMDEDHDEVALGFVPDYYKTDMHRPGPMREIVQNLEGARGYLEGLVRSLLFLGYRFPAVDIQNREIEAPCLALASSRHLDEAIQRKLADYCRSGGRLLLYGELPFLDMEGRPCTVLSDAIGIRHKAFLQASNRYHLSVRANGGHPEVRTWRAQILDGGEAFLQIVGRSEAVGVRSGTATVLGCAYPHHPAFWRELLTDNPPAFRHDIDGLIVTSVKNEACEEFVSLMNLDDEPKTFRLDKRGEALFGGLPLTLTGRRAKLLPLNVRLSPATIRWATLEAESAGSRSLVFEASDREEWAMLETDAELQVSNAEVLRQGKFTRLRIHPNRRAVIRW